MAPQLELAEAAVTFLQSPCSEGLTLGWRNRNASRLRLKSPELRELRQLRLKIDEGGKVMQAEATPAA